MDVFRKHFGKGMYLCTPGSAAVDENNRLALDHIPSNKLLRFRLCTGDHLLGQVTWNPLQMIFNPRHVSICHLATLGAAGVQVFPGVSRVNVCVNVHGQGLHHGGDARDLPQGVQVQVREKAVGRQLHPDTTGIVGTAFQRSRLFLIQGLCGGKEAWKLEESLVGSVEVPLPGS